VCQESGDPDHGEVRGRSFTEHLEVTSIWLAGDHVTNIDKFSGVIRNWPRTHGAQYEPEDI
jgi:hypothetical protein